MSTRTLRFTRIVALFAATMAGAAVPIAGCSSDDRPGAGSGISGGEAGLVDVTIREAQADVQREAAALEPCLDAPVNDAPTVRDEFVAATRPPALGGVIKPGLYHLVKSEIHTGAGGRSGDVGSIIRRTVRFTNDSMAYSESEGTIDGGIDESDTQGKNYDTDGTTLIFTRKCASAEGTFPKGNIEYSVVGEEIHLLLSFSQREILRPVSGGGADAATD